MTPTLPIKTGLVRQVSAQEHELRALLAQVEQLRETLAARELAIGDLRVTLLSFEGRYIRQVGVLFKQLDEWNAKREALHPHPESASMDDDHAATETVQDPSENDATMRLLFRQLARLIHPDFARNDDDAERRTRLMAQANEAFLRRDRATLERMLHGHDTTIEFTSAAAATVALERARDRHSRLRQDLASAEAEFHALSASDLAQLRNQVLTAARDGRDLLAESAIRVQSLIGMAMHRYELDLDRIRRPPRGLQVESLLSAEAPEPTQPRFDPKRHTWLR